MYSARKPLVPSGSSSTKYSNTSNIDSPGFGGGSSNTARTNSNNSNTALTIKNSSNTSINKKNMSSYSRSVALPPVSSSSLINSTSSTATQNNNNAIVNMTNPMLSQYASYNSTTQHHQQQQNFPNNNNNNVIAEAESIPFQRIYHGNIPVWEQERLLREVLTAMMLSDMMEHLDSNDGGENNNNFVHTNSNKPSLNARANQAATEVVSNFVTSAITGVVAPTTKVSTSLSQNQNNTSRPTSKQQKQKQHEETASGANSVSLGALNLPSSATHEVNKKKKRSPPRDEIGQGNFEEDDDENNSEYNNNNEQENEDENSLWVKNVRDRRQLQLERLLYDAQGEVHILKQQLEDITRAHDDGQRALNQAYHEYDALQRHVLELRGKEKS